MNPMRRAALLVIVLCTASAAGAQMVWVPYENNPIWPPPEAGTWCDKVRWVTSMVLVGDTWACPGVVVFQGGAYHIWYAASPEHLWAAGGIGYATSTDGMSRTSNLPSAKAAGTFGQAVVEENILWNEHGFRGAIDVCAGCLAGLTSDHNAIDDAFNINGVSSVLDLTEWHIANGQDASSLVASPLELVVDPPGSDFHLDSDSRALDTAEWSANVP